MAIAMGALSDLFSTIGPVVRVRTVPKRESSRTLHHLSRLGLVGRALCILALHRQRSGAVVFSVDAGYGMYYTIVLAYVARRLRYLTVFDHHSYAYVKQHSKPMAVLLLVGGPQSMHVFKCGIASDAFQRIYRRSVLTRVVGVAYAVDAPPRPPQYSSHGRTLTLGHLGNLSFDKGLADVLRVGGAAVERGIATQLVLAGPCTTPEVRRAVEQAVSRGIAEYRGPVQSDDKAAFFDDVDVFLFPSRYRNELAPVVIWESLSYGVPVIGYKIGCLTQETAGEGGLIIDPTEDFVGIALDRIEQWVRSPAVFRAAQREASQRASEGRERATNQALRLARYSFGSTDDSDVVSE